MPELPDITVYVERLDAHLTGQPLESLLCLSPFVLRSVDPPTSELVGREVLGFRRIGKRIVFEFSGDLFLVVHLMIAGRLRWSQAETSSAKKGTLALLRFKSGTLVFTEAGSKKRASLHVVRGEAALAEFDRGGLELHGATPNQFHAAIMRENRTLKRALTDPRIISGIGNAYSDEILFHAGLSPVQRTHLLDADAVRRLYDAARSTLELWTARLREQVGDGFPDKVTAFMPEMQVHGRYRLPCRACDGPVQRIRYATNEVNYCPRCQTGGKLLADRALSRLLKADWPRSIEELEERRRS